MPPLFDTHAHLDDEQLYDDLESVVQRAKTAGIVGIMAIGTTADSSERCVEIAERFDIVFAAVGIQPNYAAEAHEGDWDRIVALSANPLVKAVGETGLDHYWDFAPIEVQRELFTRHIKLAKQLGKPLVIHMRDAKELDPQLNEAQPCGREILQHLRPENEEGPVKGIMHSYVGNAQLARECLELGLHISFAGMVTYKKSNTLREVAATVPLERLLIETDAPYLSPHPKRGQRPNEPALVVHTAECLAAVMDIELAQLCSHTTQNAEELFLS